MASWKPDGRQMELRDEFAFIDKNEECWPVPAGACIDGASIPQFLWSITGGPYEGKYRDASVIHDWYCSRRTRKSDATHTMFYEAMIVSGVSRTRAGIMYAAVRYAGPKWSEMDITNNNLASEDRSSQQKSIRRSPPLGGEDVPPGGKSNGAEQERREIQLREEPRNDLLIRVTANEEEFRNIANLIEAERLDREQIDVYISEINDAKARAIKAGHYPFTVNQDLGRTEKPELERRVLRDVGSYGRQIGRMSEALDVLIEQADLDRTNLNDAQIAALHDFREMVEEIKRCKRN